MYTRAPEPQIHTVQSCGGQEVRVSPCSHGHGYRVLLSPHQVFATRDAAVAAWRKATLERAKTLEAQAKLMRDVAKREPIEVAP